MLISPIIKQFIFLATIALIATFITYSIRNLGNKGESHKVLKLIHIVFRHGARTPADTYPNDPHINNTLFPVGWGQITNKGKQNLYEHGLYLKKRYGDFLGNYYTPRLYYVQTTDVDRTKVSAQCINAGFWPPNPAQKWCSLDWQPIPINAEPLHNDSLLLVRRPCPQYHLEMLRVLNTSKIQDKLRANRQLFDELSAHTGKRIESFDDVQDVYTTLMSEEAYGLQLPVWTKHYYPNKMLDAAIFSYILNVYNDNLKRLKGGVLLKKLISDWKRAAGDALTHKAFLYVGHDSTIVNILSALKIWEPQLPGFAINVLFEFSYDTSRNEHGIEIFFRNSTDLNEKPHLLTIPNCEAFCSLERLIELTEAVVPVNWDEECKSDDVSYVLPDLRGP